MDLLHHRLATDLREQITQGVYGAGERLPGVRALARTRRVSISTVLAAYRRLEDDALIEARPRSGYYVRPRPSLAVLAGTAPPIGANATGTTLSRIGSKVYALMGGHGNLRAHAYPSLAELGEISMDLQPHWPKPAGRIWAGIVPLPEGYPHRYVLLTMDRANFPEIKPPTWSYGALYLYGADEPQP